jgi:hypothetical protein
MGPVFGQLRLAAPRQASHLLAGGRPPMLICSLVLFALIALFCPDTLIGRGVKRWLVDPPARALTHLTPKKALLFVALVLFAMAFAQVAPAEFVWIAAGNAVTYLEVVAATWLLAASGQALRAVGWLAARAVALGRAAARPRLRRPGVRSPRIARRRTRPPADPGEGAALAGLVLA